MKKLLLIVFGSLLFTFCEAQYVDLINFNGTGSPQGSYPEGSLTISVNGRVLYGLGYQGGANNLGCIFSLDTNSSRYKDLLDFNGTNGSNPLGGALVLSGKVLYGMAQYGGANGDGCLFSIDTDGTRYKDLFDFSGINGSNPDGELTLFGNTLYGGTEAGGAYGDGCLFSIDTDGTGYVDIFDFNVTNGAAPWGTLTISASGNVLYGMAENGALHGMGCIFSVNTNGSGYKDLLDFTNTNGRNPNGLVLAGNMLYGAAWDGGAYNDGTLFSIDTNGNRYTDLLDFNGTDGANPEGSGVLSGKILYGMTRMGGANNLGTIFTIDTNGGGYADLHDFNTSTGAEPYALPTLYRNFLYGMTEQGGTNSYGVVFRFGDTAIHITSGIGKLNANTAVSVYPNPSNGAFTLRVESEKLKAENGVVEVYNVLGEKVYLQQFLIPNSSFLINLANQPNGIYLYRMISENGDLVGQGKLVIQK